MGLPNQPVRRTVIADDDVLGFRVTIGAERSNLAIAAISTWLAGWAVGEFAVLNWVASLAAIPIAWRFGWIPSQVAVGMAQSPQARWGECLVIILVWFPFWTICGIGFLHGLLWHLGGREVIVIHEGILEVRRETDLTCRSQILHLSRVRGLRYAPEQTPAIGYSRGRSSLSTQVLLGTVGGSIAFEHDGQTHGFGVGLETSEANQLIASILERFDIAEGGRMPISSGSVPATKRKR